MDDTTLRSAVPTWIDEVATQRAPVTPGVDDAAAREQCAAMLRVLVARLETRPVPATCVPPARADWLDHVAVQADQHPEAWSRGGAAPHPSRRLGSRARGRGSDHLVHP